MSWRLALLVVTALALWLTLRASLPQLDGELAAPGAATHRQHPARRRAGIPVITARTRADLAYATGFAHGQDRFFQMDLIRRQAAGELSALFGEVAVDTDKRYRFHRFRARARAVLAASPVEQVAILQHYADGVNAGLASLGSRPFEHIVLGAEPEPWQAEDSVLVVYAMFMQLNDGRAGKDVRRGYAHRVLPPEVFDWLYPAGSRWDAPIMGEPRTPPPVPPANVFSVRDVVEIPPPAGEIGKAVPERQQQLGRRRCADRRLAARSCRTTCTSATMSRTSGTRRGWS